MEISCPVYIERTQAVAISSIHARTIESRRLVSQFALRMQNHSHDYLEPVNVDYLDTYASKHVEKWVEKVGLHFLRYVEASEPPPIVWSLQPLNATHKVHGVSVPAQKLTQKVFSGDVSGSIGEALMALLLRQHYGAKASKLTHLRGTKQTGPSPDFYLRNVPAELAKDLNPTTKSVTGPLACECKGATRFIWPSMVGKLKEALAQIDSLTAVGRYGIAAVFLRDAPGRLYHCLLTIVEP